MRPFGLLKRRSALKALSLICSSDSECDELSDGEIGRLLIVTQTPGRPKKHEGFDRTGDFVSRTKMSQDLAHMINDGLRYYEDENIDHHDEDSWVSFSRVTSDAKDIF